MAIRTSSLRAGDTVSILFKGSKSLGNEPYTLTDLAVQEVGSDRITLQDGNGSFEIYKYGKRWAYGTSAEPLSILERTRA